MSKGYEFALQQRVTVPREGVQGIVVGLSHGVLFEPNYGVRWLDDAGLMKSDYFSESELVAARSIASAAPETAKTGTWRLVEPSEVAGATERLRDIIQGARGKATLGRKGARKAKRAKR